MKNLDFRVWHKPSKQFVTTVVVYKKFLWFKLKRVCPLCIRLDGKLGYATGDGRGDFPLWADDYVVQRWTGLLDIGANKIYEGDRVSYDYLTDRYYEIVARKESQQVKYDMYGAFYTFGHWDTTSDILINTLKLVKTYDGEPNENN